MSIPRLSSHHNYRHAVKTGGSRRTWLFDTSDMEVAAFAELQQGLVHHDKYFFEEQGETTLAIVMDKLLDDLPEDLSDAIRLVHLRGKSLREAGRILGVDHKTVKARIQRGTEMMRARLTDSLWMAEMLRGYVPADELRSEPVKSERPVVDVLKTLKDGDESQQE